MHEWIHEILRPKSLFDPTLDDFCKMPWLRVEGSMAAWSKDVKIYGHLKFLAPWISHQNSCRMFIPPSSYSTHGRSHSHISLCRDDATFRLMKSPFRFSKDRPFFPQAFNLDMKGYMPVARQCAVLLDEVSASLWGDIHQAGEGFYFKFYHHVLVKSRFGRIHTMCVE